MAWTVFVIIVIIAVVALFTVSALRRPIITRPLMRMLNKSMPAMSGTERAALEAGTVWWDGEIFSGHPDWNKLLDFTAQPLSAAEQAFLDGPVNELCAMLDDWQIIQDRDLSPEVWDFIKRERFFGIIIPVEHGGLGFSAALHSAVVTKISGCSITAAVTIMVPNSLGPGELLINYGTEDQKSHYLPRLAVGDEIPCFALTEPGAGSDAANGQSRGVVCNGTWKGKNTLGMRLSFNKRYITLAPVASVIGLAFRLFDPDHLIGEEDDVGITCALIPRETEGVEIGQRHDPMGVPFQNGPVRGEDVFIPLDFIIGGQSQAGNGWRMLMETLAAGRGISLPSLSTGAAQLACRATSAYAQVREQFGLPIARFEGVREPLARIAAYTYMMDATRVLCAGAVDAGERPSVATAIAKAYLTQGMRVCLNDAMDIQAGAAIIRGPMNIFARPYSSIPIGITVEGANILTRSLIVFGQGAIRCHPFAHAEMEALAKRDTAAFDSAMFGHIVHVVRNGARAFAMSFGAARFMNTAPEGVGREAVHYRHLSRLSARFALIADVGLMTLGGALKRKEYLSGRYADAFAWMFLASMALKRFHDDGAQEAHRAFLDWCVAKALFEAESALRGVLDNLPNRFAGVIARALTFPLGVNHKPVSDRHNEAVLNALLDDDDTVRTQLTDSLYVPAADEPGLGALEDALSLVRAARPARRKIEDARRSSAIPKGPALEQIASALAANLIDEAEAQSLKEAETAREAVIQVDDFAPTDFNALK